MAIHVDISSDFGGYLPWSGSKLSVAVFDIDFSDTGRDLTQNQVMKVDKIDPGILILGGILKVTTAQSDITDVDVGISSAATPVTDDTIIDGASLASTGYYKGGDGLQQQIIQTETNDSILVFTNLDANDLDTAVVQLIIPFVDLKQ